MDLSKLNTVKAANEGFEARLFDPGTMANLPYYITVLGKDSDEHRKVTGEQNRKRMAKLTKGNQFRVGSLDTDELEQDAVEVLARCTVSWRQTVAGKLVGDKPADKPTLTLDGAELECTRENAVKLYTAYPWIREQVDTAVNDRANFLRR